MKKNLRLSQFAACIFGFIRSTVASDGHIFISKVTDGDTMDIGLRLGTEEFDPTLAILIAQSPGEVEVRILGMKIVLIASGQSEEMINQYLGDPGILLMVADGEMVTLAPELRDDLTLWLLALDSSGLANLIKLIMAKPDMPDLTMDVLDAILISNLDNSAFIFTDSPIDNGTMTMSSTGYSDPETMAGPSLVDKTRVGILPAPEQIFGDASV